MKIEIIGKFKKILWQNKTDKSVALAIFNTGKKSYKIFLKNCDFNFVLKYKLLIKNETNSKYANTYECCNLEILEVDSENILDFLTSGIFTKITKNKAKKIIELYPENTLALILKNPQLLKNIFDSDELEKKFLDEIDEYHQSFNFYKYNLNNFYKNLKPLIYPLNAKTDAFAEKLKNDPYILMENENFIFADIDTYALNIAKIKVDQLCRLKAIIINAIHELYNNNDTKFIINDVHQQAKKKYFFSTELFVKCCKNLLDDKLIRIEQKKFIIETSMYQKEFFIFDTLKKISKNNSLISFTDKDKYLDTAQKEVAIKCLNNSVSIISGYPGTGKTRTLKAILLSIIKIIGKYNKDNVVILTPTGKAALQIIEKTGYFASTVHSFFKLKAGSFRIENNKELYDKIKVLVVDEFSMFTIDLFYLILKTLTGLKKIIIVGDHNQLPAIGPGNLLEDLMNADFITINSLTKNFRSKDKVDIFNACLNVNKNQLFEFNSENIVMVECNEKNYFEKLKKVFFEDLKNVNILEKNILIPVYKKTVGINNTNKFIQSNYSNKKNQSYAFFENDKIMQINNAYEKNVFNGQLGIIDTIKYNDQNKINKLKIAFNNEIIEYKANEIYANISLAYATTIHKFQGSESKIIIFIILPSVSFYITKKLIYTALSRSIDKLYIFGNSKYFAEKILNSKDRKIATNLSSFINNQF